jgi:hypothetical protein
MFTACCRIAAKALDHSLAALESPPVLHWPAAQASCIGQSSIASTGLRPSAISAICGQHGLTSASRAMATRSARPFCRMASATPVGEMEVLGDTLEGRIGRHRCDHDAVFEAHVFDAERRKEQRLGHGVGRLCTGRGGKVEGSSMRAALSRAH